MSLGKATEPSSQVPRLHFRVRDEQQRACRLGCVKVCIGAAIALWMALDVAQAGISPVSVGDASFQAWSFRNRMKLA